MQRLALILLLSLSAQYGANAESASLIAVSQPRSYASSSRGSRELSTSNWWSNLMQGLLGPKHHKSSGGQDGDDQGDDSDTVAVQESDGDSDADAGDNVEYSENYANVADGTDGSDGWTESYLGTYSDGSYVPPSESLVTVAGEHAGIAGAMIAALVAAVAGMALVASRKARRNDDDDEVKDRMHDFVEIAEIKRESPGSYTAPV